jgi:hypothetical protein
MRETPFSVSTGTFHNIIYGTVHEGSILWRIALEIAETKSKILEIQSPFTVLRYWTIISVCSLQFTPCFVGIVLNTVYDSVLYVKTLNR